MPSREQARLFSALLKHWRSRRGLSQLDLALAADVSARHISFLETGRAQPSRDMVLRLGATLEVPLREQNAMLQAAGFDDEFEDAPSDGPLPTPIAQALDRMLAQQEPYPLLVMNHRYDVLRSNRGAQAVLAQMLAEPKFLAPSANLFHILFDPRLARRYVVEWGRVGQAMLSRLHRESLTRPDNAALGDLVRALFEYPDVPESWRQPDFSTPTEPILTLRLRRDPIELGFLTTMTVFNAPQNVALEEIKIESFFPLDEATARTCERLADERR